MRFLPCGLAFFALAGCYDPADNCLNDEHGKLGAFVASQELMSRRLKSPSTSDFPNYRDRNVIVVFEGECRFKVAAYVDAQNSFGGTVRTRYIVDIEANPVDGSYAGSNFLFD